MHTIEILIAGAIVIHVPEGTDSVKLSAVGIPKHRARIGFHHVEDGVSQEEELVAVGPVKITATPEPMGDYSDVSAIVPTSRVGIGVPLLAKARPVITLPPGVLSCHREYPGDWELDGQSGTFKVCCQAMLKVPNIEKMILTYLPKSYEIDMRQRRITIDNLPADEAADCRRIDEFEHFGRYALISHGIPGNINSPKRRRRNGATPPTAGSVCPPIRH